MISRAIHIAALSFESLNYPILTKASIFGDKLWLTFNVDTIIGGISGISLISDASALSVTSVASGSGTATIGFNLNRAPVSTETITLSIIQPNTIVSVIGSLPCIDAVDFDVLLGYTVDSILDPDLVLNPDLVFSLQ